MYVTAHRGFGDRYPQNTVRAFRAAARDADAVEVDVRRCGSGELVASHFDRLRWVTDGTGRVSETSAEALSSLSVEGSGEGVPRFDRALEAVPSDVRVDVDLKEPGLAGDVLAAVEGVDNDVVVSSFYSDSLWEIRSLDDDVALTYNFDVRLDRNLTTAGLLECGRVNVHWAACLATDVVERGDQGEFSVHAWPVGSRLVAWTLGRAGVDGVVATNPRAAEWARRGAGARGSIAAPWNDPNPFPP